MMTHALRRSIGFVLTMGMLCGCAGVPPAQPADPPVVEPEPGPTSQNTLLERFREVSRLYEAEKARAAALEKSLAKERADYAAAVQELEKLRRENGLLKEKVRRLDALQAKYDNAQKELLKLGDTIRELRRQLIEEKLARVKQEQKFIALRISNARLRRRHTGLPGPNQAGGTEEDKRNEASNP